MNRLNVEHFIDRYFDLVHQNREIHSRTLAYQSMQDTYMNTMITLMQAQANNNNTERRRQRSNRFAPSVQTAFFDLGTIFTDVAVYPTRQQIIRATREVRFSEINEPRNTRCPISQQDFSQNDVVTQIRHCGHVFYPDEINTWWERNVRCPVCRHDIREHQETTNRRRTVNEEPENNIDEVTTNNNSTTQLNNSTQSEINTRNVSTNYNNQTTLPRIRTIPRTTIPRTTFSRNSRSTQSRPDTGISDQEFSSYVNLATQLLNNFSQGDISGGIDILYTIQ